MLRKLAALAAGLIGIVLVFVTPAAATVTGPCSGQGTFESQGRTYDASTADEVVVPESDSVAYTGTIETDDPEDRSHHGQIDLELPPPLPSVRIDDWGTDDTDAVSASGVYDYDLPWIVPRGVTLNLTGEHVDTAGTCSGDVEVKIEGGPFDAPLPTIISLAVSVGAASMVWIAGKAR